MSRLFRLLASLVPRAVPTLLLAWAEGRLGEGPRKVYWKVAGYKTVTGAVLMALGTGLEAIAASYPDWTWAPPAARAVFWIGAALSSIGLVDGGVRSPWPKGTTIPAWPGASTTPSGRKVPPAGGAP